MREIEWGIRPMSWFKVDDGFHGNKKAIRAGAAALGLWVLGGSWCADNLSDGFLPDYVAARLDPEYEIHAARLVSAGLWTEGEFDGDKGWQFHDWGIYQPSAKEAKAERDSKSLGGKIGNHRRWHEAKGVVEPGCPWCPEAPSPAVHRSTDRSSDRRSESVANRPSRPVPTREETDPSDRSPARTRAHTPASDLAPVLFETGGEEIAPRAGAATVTQLFDDFWTTYPRRTGKEAARKAWIAACRKANPRAIIAAAERYAADVNREAEFTAHPTTWLNQGRWDDEPLPPRSNGSRPSANQDRLVRGASLVAELRAERDSDHALNGHSRREISDGSR